MMPKPGSRTSMRQRGVLTMTLLASACMLGGCQTEAQTDSLVGGLLGAGIGAIIGNNSGDHGWGGAGIGAAAGALGGYVIGNEIDKSRHDRYYGHDYYDDGYRCHPHPRYDY